MRLTLARLILLALGAAAAVAMLAVVLPPPGRQPEPVEALAADEPGRTRWISIGAMVIALLAMLAAFAWWQQRIDRAEDEANRATGGIAARAIPIMTANGCAGCHIITGVPGAQGLVGPRLDASLASRVYIGGVVSNNPDNMIRWIRSARQVNPRSAMPSTDISEQQARDIAAYLYALK